MAVWRNCQTPYEQAFVCPRPCCCGLLPCVLLSETLISCVVAGGGLLPQWEASQALDVRRLANGGLGGTVVAGVGAVGKVTGETGVDSGPARGLGEGLGEVWGEGRGLGPVAIAPVK